MKKPKSDDTVGAQHVVPASKVHTPGLYQIGGKTFTQEELLIAELHRFYTVIERIYGSAKGFNIESILALTSTELIPLLALLITEKGTSPEEKDVDELAAFLTKRLRVSVGGAIVRDFFDFNDPATVIQIIRVMREKYLAVISALSAQAETVLADSSKPSTTLSSSSPTEI